MKHLKKGDVYKVDTLIDLLNCPENMMTECIEAINDIFIKRLKISKKKGYSVKIVNPEFTLTNDGIQETFIHAEDLTN